MRLLITGNCGYVGSALTKLALEKGHQIIGYDNMMHGRDHMEEMESNSNLEIIEGDVRDTEKIKDLIEKSDVVIHLAGIARVDKCIEMEKEMNEVNAESTSKIAQICKENNKKLIFASSCSVYGLLGKSSEINEKTKLNPTTIYAQNKVDAEKGILKSGADAVICRFATAYGEAPRMRYDLFINEVTRDAIKKGKIELFDPEVWRCYIHTEDMAKAILFFLENNKTGTYNVGSNSQNINKTQIVQLIKEEVGEFEINILREKKDPRDYKINFDKIESEGFKVGKTIREGIKEMAASLKNGNIDPFDKKYTNYK